MTEVNGKTSFYYDSFRGLKSPLDLVQVHPACLIIREEDEIDRNLKSSIRIEKLPNDSLDFLKASHYHIGPSYNQENSWLTLAGSFYETRKRLTQVAPITFLRVK